MSSPQQWIFEYRLLNLDPFKRSVVRMVSYLFFVVYVGVVVALLISDISRLTWVGVLLLLILLDHLLHIRSAHYTLQELEQGKVPGGNVRLCVRRNVLLDMVRALERAEVKNGKVSFELLYVLLEKPTVRAILERLDIDLDEFKKTADRTYQSFLEDASRDAVDRQKLAAQLSVIGISAGTLGIAHQSASVGYAALFASLQSSGDPLLQKVFDLHTISADDVSAALAFGEFALKGTPHVTGGFALSKGKAPKYRVNRTLTSRPTPILDGFSTDVTDLIREGAVGFLIGHQKEYSRMVDVLSRADKRNALLIGEPGVGKEALVNHLAFTIVSDMVPAGLFDRRVVQLSLSDIIAGSDPQELAIRLQNIGNEIIHAGNILLCIPDIHLLAASGAASGVRLADLFLPLLRDNRFPVLGLTYPKEYKMYIESDTGFSNMFDPIRVDEISIPDAITLLSYDALVLEKKYGITISFSAIREAVQLSAKYIRTSLLPSSAQDLMREVLADASQRHLKRVSAQDVAAIVERKVNVPIHRASADEAQKLLNLEEQIHKTFIDQEDAVRAVSQALRSYRAGLSRKGGPIATFLFVGPTGVGKTELSKILTALHFGSSKYMVRLDMSEYQEKDSIKRLLGSSDGRMVGSLTDSVMVQPYSLILLDELEKAHPDILNLFLQVFDDGRLTDSLGRVVDFQNTIIIATSNAHSVLIQNYIQQGAAIADFSDELKKKLTEYFKPELLNRFSDIVVFKPLSADDIVQVARLNLDKLCELLYESQGISLEFGQGVVQAIARAGYDPSFGARPLRKVIDSNIKAYLADRILSGEFSKGDTITVALSGENQYSFSKSLKG